MSQALRIAVPVLTPNIAYLTSEPGAPYHRPCTHPSESGATYRHPRTHPNITQQTSELGATYRRPYAHPTNELGATYRRPCTHRSHITTQKVSKVLRVAIPVLSYHIS